MSAERDVALTVNGERRTARAEPRTLLSDFLRQDLGMTGTHVGCEHGVCGACTVLVDGAAVRSCLMFAVQLDGHRVETVEGLAQDGEPSEVQEAFCEHRGLQCGFCTPGILMSLTAALRDGVSAEEVKDDLLDGHLCRCTGYNGIRASIDDIWQRKDASDDGRS